MTYKIGESVEAIVLLVDQQWVTVRLVGVPRPLVVRDESTYPWREGERVQLVVQTVDPLRFSFNPSRRVGSLSRTV